jgi:hypothetical protein
MSTNNESMCKVARFVTLQTLSALREQDFPGFLAGKILTVVVALLKFQPESDRVLWFKARTANAQGSGKPMIAARA